MASFWTGALNSLFNMAGMRGTANGVILDIDGVNGVSAPGDATNGMWVNVKSAALPSGAATEATLLSMYTGAASVTSAAAERYSTVKATAGVLNRTAVYNSAAPDLWLVLVNQVAAPTTGVTACVPLCEAPGNGLAIYPFPRSFSLGCHVCLSTNPTTYTDPGAVGWFASWRD